VPKKDLEIDGSLLEYIIEKSLKGYEIHHGQKLPHTYIDHDFIIGKLEKPIAAIFVTKYQALPASQFKFLRNIEELFELKVNYPNVRCISVLGSESWVFSHKKLMRELFDGQIILSQNEDIYQLLTRIAEKTKGKDISQKKKICDCFLKEGLKELGEIRSIIVYEIKKLLPQEHQLIVSERNRIKNKKNEFKSESKKHRQPSLPLKRVICRLLPVKDSISYLYELKRKINGSNSDFFLLSKLGDFHQTLEYLQLIETEKKQDKVKIFLHPELSRVIETYSQSSLGRLLDLVYSRAKNTIKEYLCELRDPIKSYEKEIRKIVKNAGLLYVQRILEENPTLLQKFLWVINYYAEISNDRKVSQHELSKVTGVTRQKIREFLNEELSPPEKRKIAANVSKIIEERLSAYFDLLKEEDCKEIVQFCIQDRLSYYLYNNSKIQPTCELVLLSLDEMKNSNNRDYHRVINSIDRIEGFPHKQDGIELTEDEFTIKPYYPTKANMKLRLKDDNPIIIYSASADANTHKHKERAAISRFFNKEKIKASIHLLSGTAWANMGRYRFEVLDMLKKAGWDFLLLDHEIMNKLPSILVELVNKEMGSIHT